MKSVFALVALCLFATSAFAVNPKLVFKNQQGEETIGTVLSGGTTFIGAQIPANTIPGNLTGSTAYPTANTYSAVALKLGVTDLQNGKFTPQVEVIIAAGAVSTTIMESTVSNVTAGTYAVTLAAPSAQDGQIKIIKAVATMTHTVTMALTNVSMGGSWTPTGTTTLTFTSAGDSAVFMAVGGKWVYIGGSAVAS